MFKFGKKNKLVFRFLLPYMLLLLIPLILGLTTYKKSIGALESEIDASNMAMLEQNRNILDSRFAEINNIIQEIAYHPKIASLQVSANAFEGKDVYQIIEAEKSLYHYDLVNNFVFKFFVVFDKSGVVMTHNNTYRLSHFYGPTLKFEGLGFDEWYDRYIKQYYNKEYLPPVNIEYEGKRHTVLPVVHSLGRPGSIQGAIMILVDSEQIQGLLKGLNVSDGGWAYISDDRGQIISSVSTADSRLVQAVEETDSLQGLRETELDSKPMVVTHTSSPGLKWKHVLVQPAHIVREKQYELQLWIATLIVLSLLIGVGASWFLAYRNSRPVKKLMALIAEKRGADNQKVKDAYGYIQDGVTALIQRTQQLHLSNEKLAAKMKEQSAFLSFSLYERLLRGHFRSVNELGTFLNHMGASFGGNYYCTVVLDPRFYNDGPMDAPMLRELEIHKIAVKNILQHDFGAGAHIHENEENQVILLFAVYTASADEAKRELAEGLNSAKRRLMEQYRIGPAIAVGRIYNNPLDISRSYEQAKQALNEMSWQDDERWVWTDEMPRRTEGYEFATDVETRLSNLTLAGDRQGVSAILNDLYETNIQQRQLTSDHIRLFLFDLTGTLIKLRQQAGSGQAPMKDVAVVPHEGILFPEDVRRIFEEIAEQFMALCRMVLERKRSGNEVMLNKIRQRIDTEYVNPNMSLSMVADEFMISEVYLSQFFKEQMGMNFSDYVEKKRLDHAVRLLVASGEAIAEIASSVGYNSSNTFFKAFKRAYGMSPTEYRKCFKNRMEPESASYGQHPLNL